MEQNLYKASNNVQVAFLPNLLPMFKIIQYLNSYAPEHSEQKDLSQNVLFISTVRGYRGIDRMVVGFTITYAVSAYHQ
jgi:hypothetical protein